MDIKVIAKAAAAFVVVTLSTAAAQYFNFDASATNDAVAQAFGLTEALKSLAAGLGSSVVVWAVPNKQKPAA